MTPKQIEQERAAFEAWVKGSKEGGLPVSLRKDKEKSYFNPLAEVSFMAWLARAEQSSWISVEDRLPEQDANYLIFTPMGRILIARFYPGMNAWWWYSETMHPTHWQPLPQPPEGDSA